MSDAPLADNEPSASSSAPRATKHVEEADEISILDLVIALAKRKWLVLGLPFGVGVLAVVYALSLPNIYTATAKILPPQPAQSATSAMLAQLGGLTGAVAGLKTPNDLYVAMLKSRTVADNLIQRFGIMQPDDKRASQVRARLAGVTHISAGLKDGIITIEVDDKDPKRAAALANAYVDELHKLTSVLAVTEASKRRLFFERQFLQAKESLAKAEVAARRGLQQGGLVKVDDQGRAMIETTARLRAQMAVKEVQIGAMRAFAAEGNPDLRLVQQELEAMRRELARIEGAGSAYTVDAASGGRGMENLRLLRDLKYNETIYELLAKQYEMAKIEEAKDSSVVQVLDEAVEPDTKSKPVRRQMVIVAVLVAGALAVLLAFVLEALERVRTNREQSQRLMRLKEHLRLRRRSSVT